MGMGAMLKTCPECKGVGHVKVEKDRNFSVETIKPIDGVYDLSSRTKRPYNRKKVNDERTEA